MTKEIFTYSYKSADAKYNKDNDNNILTFNFRPPNPEKPTSKYIFRLANFAIPDSTPATYPFPILEIRVFFTSNYVYNSNGTQSLSMFQDLSSSALITRMPEYIIDISGQTSFDIAFWNPYNNTPMVDSSNQLNPSFFVFELTPIY